MKTLLLIIFIFAVTSAFAYVQDNRMSFAENTITVQNFDLVYNTYYYAFENEWHPRTCSGTQVAADWLTSCTAEVLLPVGTHYVISYACDVINAEYACDWVLLPFEVKTHPQKINPQSQFGLWKNVGGSTPDDSVRNIRDVRGPEDTEFWNRFLAQYVTPYTEQGIRRVQLHNPFGTINNSIEFMAFDQYLDASETIPGLASTFVDAIKPLTDDGIEVIAYVGSPLNDRDMDTMSEPEKWEYAQRALQPLFDAQTSIALDAATLGDEQSFTYKLAEALRARGIRVYVESRSPIENPHWFDYNQVQLDSRWRFTDPAVSTHPLVAQKFPSNDVFPGEIVRMFRWAEYDPANPEDKGKIEAVVNDGHAIFFHGGMWEDVKPFFDAE